MRRQAIASLRGYAYQLHQSLAAWIALPDDATLHLEVAEDYATVARDPVQLDHVLNATQVKETRESGSVTLNSQDVREAIEHFWALQEANPARPIHLTFLTTSPIGKERLNALADRVAGLEAWQLAAEDGDVAEIRAALRFRFTTGTLADFLRDAPDAELRDRLLRPIAFACGAPGCDAIEAANRAALVTIRGQVQSTADLATRACDVLLAEVLRTIVDSPTRDLTRNDFLNSFGIATSLAMPSEVVARLAAKAALSSDTPAEARPLEELHLRRIARTLLMAGKPPSLLPLFSGAAPTARRALEQLEGSLRIVRDVDPAKLATAAIGELAALDKLHHLLIAPPGSGKTHALWHAAQELLDHGTLIPLFIPLGGLTTWADVVQSIADAGEGVDTATVFHDKRVCVIFDGWSEFASGRGATERARAMRMLNLTRIVANARRGSEQDTFFRVWNLEPLSLSDVTKAIRTAFPDAPPTDSAVIELLRLPLALSLFILLDGSARSRGELLARLHARLSNDLPESFRDVVAGAVASVSLAGGRSFAKLQSAVRDRAALASIGEPLRLLAELGTLEDRSGTVLPVHDLYWSWLGGIGFLGEATIKRSLPDLSTRESYQLAIESGAQTSASMVDSACAIDAILASTLSTGLAVAPTTENGLSRQIRTMFADDRLPVRCRAAIAGLHSHQAGLLRPALDVLTETLNAKLYVPALVGALAPEPLFPYRGIIAEWIGANGTELLIDAIAARGGSAWGPWLEQLAHSGKLPSPFAAAAALACEPRLPAWTIPHLPDLVTNQYWKLRGAASRGANVELALWVAEHYEEYIDTGCSRWFELNKVLLSCGDDKTFEYLLSRFSSLPGKAQETLGFAVVELGDQWIARFQKLAFASPGTSHHHKLAEVVSLEIDDETARRWIANGYAGLGWRVLIARHGNAIIPELITNLPESFGGLHDIPALTAMRFLVDPPESLMKEIWGRVGGLMMMPKATEDVINAVVRIRPAGMASVIQFAVQQSNALPTYHLGRILQHLKEWEGETHATFSVREGAAELPFREWILRTRLPQDKDDTFFRHLLSSDPNMASRAVMDEFRRDNRAAKSILGQITPVLAYDSDLFEHLVTTPELSDLIPKIFSRAFDTFPEDALMRAMDAPGIAFDAFVRGLAVSSSPTHMSLHGEIVRRTLSGSLDLFLYRDVAKILRVHPRSALLRLLKGVISGSSANEIWLVREIETERRELLIDEAGSWLE